MIRADSAAVKSFYRPHHPRLQHHLLCLDTALAYFLGFLNDELCDPLGSSARHKTGARWTRDGRGRGEEGKRGGGQDTRAVMGQ